MAKRRMSALQRKYFGKGHKKVISRRTQARLRVHQIRMKHYEKRRKRVMARRYRGYARKAYSRAGGFKGMLAPILAGVGDSYLDPMLPIDGISAVGVGLFMHNSTVKDIGLYKVGMSLGNILPLPGRSGGQGGVL